MKKKDKKNFHPRRNNGDDSAGISLIFILCFLLFKKVKSRKKNY